MREKIKEILNGIGREENKEVSPKKRKREVRIFIDDKTYSDLSEYIFLKGDVKSVTALLSQKLNNHIEYMISELPELKREYAKKISEEN